MLCEVGFNVGNAEATPRLVLHDGSRGAAEWTANTNSPLLVRPPVPRASRKLALRDMICEILGEHHAPAIGVGTKLRAKWALALMF
ncbi:MAG: hypothetical protein CMA10_04570 [Euryarchaeota archaeon]|nr:hypothetical protein [Euryarchaeota archaeon]